MAEKVVKRDVRVDQIGLANEVAKHFADPLKQKVKQAHGAGTLLEGDLFTARIDESSKTICSVQKWHAMYEKGELKKSDYLRGLAVSTTEARTILSEADFERISETVPGEDRLTVTRKKGVEIGLVQAIDTLRKEIDVEPRLAA